MIEPPRLIVRFCALVLSMRYAALFTAAIVLFASIATTAADVAVWKGKGKQTLTNTDETLGVSIYFIVDLDNFVGRAVVAIPSSKQVYDEGERSYGINLANTTPKGFMLLTDAIASPQNGPLEFNHQIAVARGKTSTLFTGPQDTAPKKLPLTFNYLLTKAAGGIFVQVASHVEGLLTYQEQRTQAANAVGKTVLAVSQEIRAELISGKGFTEVSAP
jgi:hypothetical protein